jgi:ABC-type antimicrobial peptide transport system permease subunit
MAQGLTLALLGVAVGLGLALAVNAALASKLAGLLFEVRALDPSTFVVVGIVVAAVAALACWIPARQATRVDPMVALRHD